MVKFNLKLLMVRLMISNLAVKFVLQPGERVQMPVSFFVDPEIVEDHDAKYTKHITLSYTFYEIDLPEEEQAALDTEATDQGSVN